mmetsp:Transcript_30518/g.68904  ORF Transcript_30518/g.68904 Transcript_30518/m.68904 type:complete len:113 (-) Transcript_30518:251-589(-)
MRHRTSSGGGANETRRLASSRASEEARLSPSLSRRAAPIAPEDLRQGGIDAPRSVPFTPGPLFRRLFAEASEVDSLIGDAGGSGGGGGTGRIGARPGVGATLIALATARLDF